jgi:hypothetical protein
VNALSLLLFYLIDLSSFPPPLYIDPDLVKDNVRDIPERERKLSSPHYDNYIKKHGTNIVKVKAHKKSFPMLNDHNRVTRAKAKRYEKKI